jgi:threonine dehydrogenase-like Zn-dependent dehydrogenase
MQAVRFDSQLHVVTNQPVPMVPKGEALLRVRQVGVCSTDIEITRGYMGFSGTLGHEFVATVEQCEDRALMGKRVVGEINCVCTSCDMCVGGLSNHCRNRTVLGIVNRDGCFAEFCVLPANNLHVLPDQVDDDMAVFVEPLAAAVQVTKQVRMDSKTFVTVVGGGRLGLLVAQVVNNLGVPVRVIGRDAAKLSLCERWQIRSRHVKDIQPRKDQDVVIDCTGSSDGLELAMQLVRPRGTLVLKSTFVPTRPLNLAPIVVDEINVIGSRCGPFAAAIQLMADRAIDVTSLISRRFKLDQAPAAIEHAQKPGVLKVLMRG